MQDLLPQGTARVLVTGGAGFIGGAVVRRLLADTTAHVFNLDKLGYASDLSSIEALPGASGRHQLQRVDLTDAEATAAAVRQADPDLVMHLAAESHVDRSIDGPGAFIESNVTGTFNLLQAVRAHWEQLPAERRERFRFHHISTDEVFGSLGPTGRFSETTPYDPRSPYSASKAASDHLVSAWHHTYGLPVVLTNCSNNYGPWQFPEKLIPVVILKAVAGEPIPLYGDGANVRDWLYAEDHVEALLLAATRGRLGESYCVGGAGDDQPSEDDRQHALRDVVAHCIYAVDKNPMAVELCKVALWIEAIDPGKPLSFLDAHIQCGDSLVGVFDPKVLEEGIPDGAFKPLTGDNKTVCTSLKKENAAARKTISRRGSNRGIQGSLALSGTQPRSQGQQALQAIEAMPETTLAETAAKQAAYAQWLSDRGQDPEALAADLYTAAFFLAKTSDSRATVPTTEHLLKLLAGQPVDEAMEEAVVEAAQNFRFFHWHLRFGEVMEQGGFDCVLGNPPWERIKLQEKEFFAARSEAIATAPNKAARERLNPAISSDLARLAG